MSAAFQTHCTRVDIGEMFSQSKIETSFKRIRNSRSPSTLLLEKRKEEAEIRAK
jgi:hypothetical protein